MNYIKKRPVEIFFATLSIVFLLSFTSLANTADPSKENADVEENLTVAHAINIIINIGDRKVSGTDNITLKKAGEARLYLRSGSVIDKIELDGKKLDFTAKDQPDGTKEVIVKVPESNEKTLKVDFHGTFATIESSRKNLKRGVAYVEDGVVGEEGVFLPASSYWYPQEKNGLFSFDITVGMPAGYTAVTEGDWAESADEAKRSVNRWKTDRPIEGMDLIASRFVIRKENYKGIDLYTFFFKEDEDLSKTYLDKTKGYLDLYQSMIGLYPYKKFAVVENFIPTGYGMPSFTLLGSVVLRLPFIPDTSLGHEIAHNWWGNGVFIDNSEGNWSEAITTYTADYLFARKKGEKEGMDFRLGELREYKNFVGRNGIAIKDFVDSTTTASRAVGYNKGCMVFNMLNRHLGDEKFVEGLKVFFRDFAFKKAAWHDIEASFEKASGEDLTWFFKQWVYRAGGPMLSISGEDMTGTESGFTVKFNIRQAKPAYKMELPVLFKTSSGDVWKSIVTGKEEDTVEITLEAKPVSFEIDPLYENFRIFSDDEMPPSLAAFFGKKNGVIIIPNSSRLQERYVDAAYTMAGDYHLTLMTDAEVGMKDYLKDSPLFVFGGPGENLLFAVAAPHVSKYVAITGDSYEIRGKTYSRSSVLALAIKNPHNPIEVICFLLGNGSGKDTISRIMKRMRYYSESSYVVFKEDGKVEKGTFDGTKALKFVFENK